MTADAISIEHIHNIDYGIFDHTQNINLFFQPPLKVEPICILPEDGVEEMLNKLIDKTNEIIEVLNKTNNIRL